MESGLRYWDEPRTRAGVKLLIFGHMPSREWRALSDQDQYDLLVEYPARTRAMRQSERKFFGKR